MSVDLLYNDVPSDARYKRPSPAKVERREGVCEETEKNVQKWKQKIRKRRSPLVIGERT